MYYFPGYEEFLSVKNKSVGIYLTNHQINVNILKALDKEKNDFVLFLIHIDTNPLFFLYEDAISHKHNQNHFSLYPYGTTI